MKMQKKLTVMLLACAAAIPAFAQNTSDSYCGATNYDARGDMYTIVNPMGTLNQQCFVTVVPKQSWTGGTPNLTSSQLVEGNYEITLSGGGGGGGGGAGSSAESGRPGAGGHGGYSAVPVTTVRYLTPGVYRLTIGAGGQGGVAGSSGQTVATGGGHGADGAPTSLSNAYSGETVAGFHRAETFDGNYPLVALASHAGAPAPSGERGAAGSEGAGHVGDAHSGASGGDGFIKLALKDPVPAAAPVPSTGQSATPGPAAARPARRDRN